MICNGEKIGISIKTFNTRQTELETRRINMRNKIGLVLCMIGLLGIIAIPYYIKTNQINEENIQQEIVENTQINLYQFDQNNISRIEIKDERALILQKQDERWVDSEYADLDYQKLAVEEIINTISSLESTQVIYEVLDQKKYGIDDTARIITLYDADNNNYTLRLGNATLDKSGVYLGTHLDETLYVVKSQVVQTLFQTRDDLIEKQVERPLEDNWQDIQVIKKNEPIIHIQKSQQAGYKDYETWVLEGFFKQTHELHTEDTQDIINQILKFEKDKFVGKKENLVQYGLDDPQLTLILNNKWTIKFGIKENEWVYFMTSDDPYIYKMLEEKIDVMRHIKPITLIRKQVYIPDYSKLNQVVLSHPEGTLVLEYKKEVGPLIKLIQDNICIEAVLQNPEIEERQERKAEIIISYHFEEGDAKTIELIPYDNQFYILRSEGIIEFAVGKQQVMSMLNTLNETIKTSSQ